MSFKYINPGYGYLVNPAFHTIRSTLYSPKFGVSFWYKRESGAYKGYTIPAIGYGGTLYFKFDVYIPRETFDLIVGFGTGSESRMWLGLFYAPGYEDNYHSIALRDTYGENRIEVDNGSYGDFLNFDAVNTIWVELRLEDESYEGGSATVKINGKTVGECENLETEAQNETTFLIDASEKTPISNFIISDEEIDLRETIVEVGNTCVETTMTENEGAYSSAQTGDYVLQTLDTTALYSLFGSESKVTGLAAIAEPAYTTGDDVTSLKCRTVDGETVTDYSAQNLSSDTSAMLAEYLQLSSDTTFADLNGLKVGWVTA